MAKSRRIQTKKHTVKITHNNRTKGYVDPLAIKRFERSISREDNEISGYNNYTRNLQHGEVTRAQCAEMLITGEDVHAIMRELGVSKSYVYRRRWEMRETVPPDRNPTPSSAQKIECGVCSV